MTAEAFESPNAAEGAEPVARGAAIVAPKLRREQESPGGDLAPSVSCKCQPNDPAHVRGVPAWCAVPPEQQTGDRMSADLRVELVLRIQREHRCVSASSKLSKGAEHHYCACGFEAIGTGSLNAGDRHEVAEILRALDEVQVRP